MWLLLRKALTAPAPEARTLIIENIGLVCEAHPGAWKRALINLGASEPLAGPDGGRPDAGGYNTESDTNSEQSTVGLVSSMPL